MLKNERYTNKYIFTVEGETEKAYLDWLKETINSCPHAHLKCNFTYFREKDPSKLRQRLSILYETDVFHLIDMEKHNDIDEFRTLLQKMKSVTNTKKVNFTLGYCNVSFELWILLHKQTFTTPVSSQNDYLQHINRTFNTNFPDMRRYKEEKGFKKILEQLTLDDVKRAIGSAKNIQDTNNKNGFDLKNHCGYTYYEENPSLSIHEIIEKILKDCGV